MIKASVFGRRIALLLAMLSIGVGVAGPDSAGTALGGGPAVTGDFCTAPGNDFFCMTVTWNGTAYGTTNRSVLALKPGAYMLTVNDGSAAHNFVLRSCPGSSVPCAAGNPTATTTVITTQAQV